MSASGTGKEDRYWKAVQAHEASQDGKFFYGVLTTGVYCKPSCGSRRPLRENVRFYETAAAAEKDGLRACKRCKPNSTVSADHHAAGVRRALAYLKNHATDPPKLNELAVKAGMSPYHFHRTFKRLTGVTPKKYIDGLRVRTFKRNLKSGAEVTNSVYASGFGSSSRVYEKSGSQLGMTPAQYRNGGEDITISYVCLPCTLGRMMLGATDRGLCFVQFGETRAGLRALLRSEYPLATLEPASEPYHPDFEQWIQALDRYLQGEKECLALPVEVRATAFQLRVWNYLQSIPYGEVRSYSEVAAGIGNKKAVRAVASACAANRVALLVPCHRVIRNNGDLGGYRWGLHRKRTLLDIESAQARL